MMDRKFAVFILTHLRAGNIKTLKALKNGNYTGDVYIIIDNEDDMADEYYRLYGSKVIMFDKKAIGEKFDTGDNFNKRNAVVYARNACWDIAESLGIDYFLVLDDDYTDITFRKIKDGTFVAIRCLQLDRLFDMTVDFLESSGALTVAYAQAGDFIGGKESGNFKKGILRKAMNSFFISTKRRFDFVGRINEDVNAYVYHGSQGGLFLTISNVCVIQTQTQQNKGGLTDIYLDVGTYVKSFYSVMYMPSAVVVKPMGQSHMRLHHMVSWNNCVPMILSEGV